MTTANMAPAYLIFFVVILVIIFVTNNAKLSKNGRQHEALKQTETQIVQNYQKLGDLQMIPVVFRMLYYRYIDGNPNYEVAQRMLARFGNVFGYKFLFRSMDYQLVGDPVYAKRIMSDSSWPERTPMGYYIRDAGFHKPYGLLFGGGKYYKSASRVTAKLLHQLGFFNPTTMEGRSVFEMEELERKLDVNLALNDGEHTFCPRDIFARLSINVVLHILLGKRDPFDEAVVTKLITEITANNKKLAPFASVIEIVPFLRHFPKLTFLKHFNETSNMIYDVMREVIAEKRRLGKYKDHVEDFVDGMLQHLDKNGNCEDGLNEENILVVLRDMLFGGSDTTGAMLEHALLFMSLHPEVQVKIQAEIDDVIGPDRAPSYEDRRRMPYTEASLKEIYRMGSPVPATARAKHVDNKDSFAIIILYGIHRNELFFDEPNEFKPERFLDKEDSTKVINTENLIPFGLGRRSCPGETAARVAVFVYFVVMLQKYSIKLSSHHPPPSMQNTHGLSRSPQRYYITIRRRH